MPVRVRKSAEARQEEIVAQTLRLAAKVGPDRTTTQAVADAIGISQAAIFRHFPSKAELWRAVIGWLSERMLAAWARATADADDPERRIGAIVAAQLRLIQSVPAIPAILFSRELHAENDALRQGLMQILQHLHGLLAGAVRTGQERGVFDAELDPDDAAFLIISVIQGSTIRWSLSARSFDLVATGQRMLEVLLRSFIADSRPAARRRSADAGSRGRKSP
jgi:AcrR family transcriptional regulator